MENNLQNFLKMYESADDAAVKYWNCYCTASTKLERETLYDAYLHECVRRNEVARQLIEFVKMNAPETLNTPESLCPL